MAAPAESRFERIENIAGTGNFKFAANLEERGPERLEGHGLLSDYIAGERPQWELEIIQFLRTNFPQFRHMRFQRQEVEDRLIKVAEKWFGQSGYLFHSNDYYSVYSDYDFDEMSGDNRGQFMIADVGKPYPSMGIVKHLPKGSRNGRLELELIKVSDSQQNPYWNGHIYIEGNHPGSLICEVRDFVEQKRAEAGFPVWRDSTQ